MASSNSDSIPLHIAALLLPYLSPPDLFRAQRVNRHWHSIFGSTDLAKIALRTYGAASHEQYIISHHLQSRKYNDSDLNYLELFRAFSLCTRNLRRGIANQELRFDARRAWSGEYVWCFAENYLVYLSPSFPTGLTVIFFDDEREKYVKGQIELGLKNDGLELSVLSIRSVRIAADVLLVEHTKEVPTSDGQRSSKFIRFAQAFRLHPLQNDESVEPVVEVTKLSEFQTFEFLYIDFTHALISDHTAKHLAMMNTRANAGPIRSGVGIFVWDIETGKLVFFVPVQKKSLPAGVMEVARGHQNGNERLMLVGDNHLVLARGDPQNSSKFRHSIDDDTGFKVYLDIYSLTKGDIDEHGVVIAGPEDSVHSYISRPKDDRMLQRHDHYISWNTTKQNLPRVSPQSTCNTMVFLNIWGKEPSENRRRGHGSPELEQTIQYHIQAEDTEGGELPCHAIYTHIDENTRTVETDSHDAPLPLSAEVPIDTSFFMNSSTVDGMSFDLAWSGGSKDIFGTRLMGFDFRIRNFQPSSRIQRKGDTQKPIKYHLNYSSFLKDIENPEQKRIIPSITRNVMTGADRITRQFVLGDERLTVYTDLKEERASAHLVVSVWQAKTFEKA